MYPNWIGLNCAGHVLFTPAVCGAVLSFFCNCCIQFEIKIAAATSMYELLVVGMARMSSCTFLRTSASSTFIPVRVSTCKQTPALAIAYIELHTSFQLLRYHISSDSNVMPSSGVYRCPLSLLIRLVLVSAPTLS